MLKKNYFYPMDSRLRGNDNVEATSESALVVVAHPDDETIWMGGTILMHSRIAWTIVSLCRGDDADRAPKFRRVCERYGARCFIFDLEDDGLMNIRESVPEIHRRLSQFRGERFTYLFTHAYNGEYGHPRHKGVHRAVLSFVESGVVPAERVFCFSYSVPRGETLPRPRMRSGDYILSLPQDVRREKCSIIHEIYGFDKTSFEYKSCGRAESFRLRVGD